MRPLTRSLSFIFLFILLVSAGCIRSETKNRPDKMQWWSNARFGMFIHFGLYSVLEGEWNGEVKYAEWIRNSAHIPVEVYDTLVRHFDPVNFNADEWVSTAKKAGMKYLVITTKHHDGFCLFDSKYTDFDVMSTPFKRDIIAELARACHRQGIVLCLYYSIMDWHNPDYLPRRAWETDRPADGADFNRYVAYMKNQLEELETRYGAIGVLWFDGEWESTWTHDRALDLYKYVTSLQPRIIVNNRIDTGRGGMAGMNKSKEYAGDFGTPEQEAPATGFPGTYWESCITLNNNWGYVKNDNNWKSSEYVIRMLADIASKGGNLLLNVGPRPDGTFPEQSVKILGEVGGWMKKNSSAIYGTKASPFARLPWGRCTARDDGENTILYLHVFDWPSDGVLTVPGIMNKPGDAFLLESGKKLKATSYGTSIKIDIPAECPDKINTVVVLKLKGKPLVFSSPVSSPEGGLFTGNLRVTVKDFPEGLSVHYTLDGTEPSMDSPEYSAPIVLDNSADFRAAYFCKGEKVGWTSETVYRKTCLMPATEPERPEPGLRYVYCEGSFDSVPLFSKINHTSEGVMQGVGVVSVSRAENFAQLLDGYIEIPADGVYTFSVMSDDGSKLVVDGLLVADNDGFHSTVTKQGQIALGAGYHRFSLGYIQGTGDKILSLSVTGPEGEMNTGNAFAH